MKLIGHSKTVRNLTKQISKLSAKPGDILIIGEQGTGKGVIAKNIHTLSIKGNSDLPLVRLKLAHLTEKDLSAVLFGYGEGTPGLPDTSRNGLSAIANGGTILIDEIETTSFRNQKKVLEFLNQLREIRKRSDEIPIDVRIIITAKNDPLKLAQKNELIADLAHHISGYTRLFVPPLRERKEDIPYFVEHFVTESCKKIGIEEPVIDINAIGILINQPWKNNIHELKMVIERAVVFSTNGMFTLPQEMIDDKSKVTRMLETVLTGEGQEIEGSLDTIERGLIGSALKRFNFDFLQAAQFLGMNQQTLEHRAHQLGVVRIDR
jgi:DNA-binding NtrC family response regulator